MKALLKLTAVLLLSISTIPAAFAASFTVHIILSPFYEPREREQVSSALAELFLSAPQGTHFHVLDGWNLQTIADMTLPDNLLMADSVPVKKKAIRPGLARLLQWLEKTGAAAPQPGLSGTAIIDLPRALELVSANAAGQNESILIIASPIYHSILEPQFSFLPDRFPTDAHLFGDKSISVFSVTDKRQRLQNRRVFIWYPNERVFLSELYRDRVERFWSLFVAYQQGTLAAFSADGGRRLTNLFRSDVQPVRRDRIDPTLNKVEMLTVYRDVPYRKITNATGQITFVVEPAPTVGTQPAERRAERVVVDDLGKIPYSKSAVGIMWSIPGLDLDLYVWQRDGVQPLYYQNVRTPEGVYVHDYTDRNDQLDYEKVILDLPPEPLESMKIAVNFFGGQTSQPVTGKVFVRHHGKTYAGAFSLAAKQGNQGGDRDSRMKSSHWTEILVSKLTPVGTDFANRAN